MNDTMSDLYKASKTPTAFDKAMQKEDAIQAAKIKPGLLMRNMLS